MPSEITRKNAKKSKSSTQIQISVCCGKGILIDIVADLESAGTCAHRGI